MSTEQRPAPRVAVLSTVWGHEQDETAFAMRAVAGALSQQGVVDVLVPGPVASAPDGAFDVHGVGMPGPGRRWPSPEVATWPDRGRYGAAVIDDTDQGARTLAGSFLPHGPLVGLASWAPPMPAPGGNGRRTTAVLAVGLADDPGPAHVGCHVPVHPLAAAHSHVGLGFTGYLLVLGDRGPEAADDDRPSPLARWLATRFADRHLVVVENGMASVWRWRSLRGLVSIFTRADLLRLIAHARATVDLAPGRLLARECVESLRYGVPIVVPAGTAGARLAAAGGGLWFGDPAELLACVEALDDDRTRDTLGGSGRAVADRWYGDPQRFVARVHASVGIRFG